MKKRDLNFKLGVVFVVIIGLFVMSHLSPKLALRTHLFFSGHPVSSMTADIRLAEKVDDRADIYELQEPVVERATQSSLERFEVTRYSGIFYFAEYAGEV
ncbi:hypothetical protein [Enterococcus faecium]|uniref:hypothetical protein n=1 Tax=Enterococcus faecium TaxID=1352 RepID=UPI00272ED793|nr:hypothetical protein [Enterococcus faecium]